MPRSRERNRSRLLHLIPLPDCAALPGSRAARHLNEDEDCGATILSCHDAALAARALYSRGRSRPDSNRRSQP